MSKSTPLNQLPFTASPPPPPAPAPAPVPMQQTPPPPPQVLQQMSMPPAMSMQQPLQQSPSQTINVSDTLDDDVTVNDVLRQINGSFQPTQAPSSYVAADGTCPTLQMQQQQSVGGAAQPMPFAPMQYAPAPLLPPPAQPQSFTAYFSTQWTELLRVAGIVAMLYIFLSFVPVDSFIEKYLPSLANWGHAAVCVKAAALAGMFMGAMKLPVV